MNQFKMLEAALPGLVRVKVPGKEAVIRAVQDPRYAHAILLRHYFVVRVDMRVVVSLRVSVFL
jgi:hypothetical protein